MAQCKTCKKEFESVHRVGHSERTGKDYDFWTKECDACFKAKKTAAPASNGTIFEQKPAAAAPPAPATKVEFLLPSFIIVDEEAKHA